MSAIRWNDESTAGIALGPLVLVWQKGGLAEHGWHLGLELLAEPTTVLPAALFFRLGFGYIRFNMGRRR
jgi:hypothetical protein